ncbi:MAG: MFS transporter [Promethearchaeota archaeon]
MANTSRYQPIRGQIVFWGLLTFGSQISSIVLDTFLVGFYFFDVLETYTGPGAVERAFFIGAAVAIGKILQGLFNLPVARFSDHFRTRWGRRRVFILIGCIPWAFTIVMLFAVPSAFPSVFAESLVISVGWLAVWFLFYNIMNAFVVNPYLAMLPEIAKTSMDRTAYQQVRIFFQFTGIIVGVLLFPLLDRIISALIIAILMIIMSIITFLGSREDASVVPATVSFTESVKAVFQNRAFTRYIGTIMATMAVQGVLLSALPIILEGILGIDIDSDVVIPWLGLDPGIATSIISGIFVITALLIIPVIGIIQRKIGKKKSFQLYLWLFAIFSLGMVLVGILPGTPPMGTDDYYRFVFLQLVITILLVGAPAGGVSVLVYSIFSDVIDNDPLGDEQRRESMYFAVQGVLDWGAASVGTFLMGVILAIFGSSDFRLEDMGILGTGSTGIRLLGLFAFLVLATSAYIFRKYPIEN